MSKNPPTLGDLLSGLGRVGNSFGFGGSAPSADATNALGQALNLTTDEARDRSRLTGLQETGYTTDGRAVRYTNGERDTDFGNLF